MCDRTRWATGFAGTLLTVLWSAFPGVAAAAAEEARDPEVEQRWVPGLSIFGSGHIQDRSGSVESSERGSFSGNSTGVFAAFGLSAELSTPVLSFAPGRPRLFVRADVTLGFDTEEPVVNEADPGPIVILSVTSSGGQRPIEGVQGRGSAVRVQAQRPLGSAGIGLSFALPLWDRNLRLKPSLEWSWQEDQLRMLFGEAQSEGPDPKFCQPSCRTLEIDARKTQGFQSLGPGFEVELDAGRTEAFLLTVYGFGRAYRILNSREIELEVVKGWTTPTSGPRVSKVTSSYEREPWHYSVGLGVRLRWLPE